MMKLSADLYPRRKAEQSEVKMSHRSNGSSKRRDINEKVRSIKAQQEKWMNERCAEKEPRKNSLLNHQLSDVRTPKSQQHSPRVSHYNPAQYESRPMSSKDFDSKADEIISRVKSQLAVGVGRSNDEPVAVPLATADKHPTAHICPNCQQLMVSPNRSPMMLIPCGHSFCHGCCEDIDFCYLCSTEVTSLTNNIMLEQVIVSASRKQAPSRRPAVGNCEDARQNLLVRKETLHEERCNIEKSIESIILESIKEERMQIETIERKEEKILQQISQLQKEMVALQSHKAEYQDNIKSHEVNIASNRQKIGLIDQTILDLDKQIAALPQ